MNEKNFLISEKIISNIYIKQASQARKQRENMIKDLLSQVIFYLYYVNK